MRGPGGLGVAKSANTMTRWKAASWPNATKDSAAFRETFHGKDNVFDPRELKPGPTYL